MNEVSNLGFEKGFEVQLNSEFSELLIQLQDSTVNPVTINFETFSALNKYQIKPDNYKPTSEDRVVASLVLSRVVFNSERTKAAYYYLEQCGVLCGNGYVVFAERTSAGWTLIGKNLIWLS